MSLTHFKILKTFLSGWTLFFNFREEMELDLELKNYMKRSFVCENII